MNFNAVDGLTGPSTVHKVLTRLGLNRLKWMGRPTGRVIRRYEQEHSGDLVHVDIKKLGRISNGGGGRANGHMEGAKSRHAENTPSGELRLHSLRR
jgi:hypothetical protein